MKQKILEMQLKVVSTPIQQLWKLVPSSGSETYYGFFFSPCLVILKKILKKCIIMFLSVWNMSYLISLNFLNKYNKTEQLLKKNMHWHNDVRNEYSLQPLSLTQHSRKSHLREVSECYWVFFARQVIFFWGKTGRFFILLLFFSVFVK